MGFFAPNIMKVKDLDLEQKVMINSFEYVCVLGVDGLSVHWLPIGTAFEVDEYDGAESLRTIADLVLVA